MVWPMVVAGAAALGSAYLQKRSSEKTNRRLEGSENRQYKYSDQMWEKNLEAQKQFAKMGVRWRVEDAKKAGLHPLAALGASGASYTPSSHRIGTPNYKSPGDYGVGAMGQNIGRAMSTMKTAGEKMYAAIELKKQQAELDNMNLRNIGLKMKLDQLKSSPGIPTTGGTDINATLGIEGQPQTQGFSYEPSIYPMSESVGIQSGISPLEQNYIDSTGHVTRMPIQSASEPLESSWYHSIKYSLGRAGGHAKGIFWYYANQRKGSYKHRQLLRSMRPKKTPFGYEWRYDPWKGGFQLSKIGNGKFGSRFYLTGQKHIHN